jgi:protein TonB
MIVIRYSISIVLGVCITLTLLYIMQALIQSGQKVMKEDPGEFLIDYVRVKEAQALRTVDRKPKPPPPPDSPPPDLPQPSFDTPIDPKGYTMTDIVVDNPTGPSGPGLMISDGEYLPIVQVQPTYPRQALARGLVGWVIIEFTVTASGSVIDPFIVSNCAVVQAVGREVAECQDRPNRIFDTAALRAALKFKYKPKVIAGIAMATAGVQNKITFELEDD